MPQKKKKHNASGSTQPKVHHEKHEVIKATETCSLKVPKNLTSYFKHEEIQELKNVLKKNNLNKTPLILLATVLEKTALIEEVLRQGQNIQEADENNISALVWAVKRKKLQSIKTLLSHGADPLITTDHHVDHILTMALETKIWDELSLIALWECVQCVSKVDVNFINKNGHSMLHMAVRREWVEFIEILMLEDTCVDITNAIGITPLMLACYRNNINIVNILLDCHADVRKEDDKGFTPLCYAFSSAITKTLKHPYLVIEILLEKLHEHNVTLQDYISKKIEQIINLNCKIMPSFDMSAHVVSFIINEIEDGAKLCFKLNILQKIQEALQRNINNPDHLKFTLMVLNEIFKYTEQSKSLLAEDEVMDRFITDGCADVCLRILKKYDKHETQQWIAIICLQCLIASCIRTKICEIWFEKNYYKFLYIYTKFSENNLINNINVKELKDYSFKINEDKLQHYSNTMSLLQSGEKLYEEEKYQEVNIIRETQSEHSVEKFNSKSVDTNQDAKSNSKKTKRRTKALKAKIAKIKSADLAERLNIAVKKSVEPKGKSEILDCESAQVSISKQLDEDVFLENPHNIYLSYIPSPLVSMQSEIVDAIKSTVLSNFDIEKQILNKKTMKEKINPQLDWKTKIQQIPFEHKCYPHYKLLSEKIGNEEPYSNFYSLGKETEGRLNQMLKYLCELLQRIIERYKKHWQIDRELENELYLRKDKEEKSEYVVHILQNLEQEKVQLLQSEFGRILSHIRTIAAKNPEECDSILKSLETTLLTHQIRGRNILSEVVPSREIQIEINYEDSFTNEDNFALPKYMEDVLNNKAEAIDEIHIKLVDHLSVKKPSIPVMHTDDLYLKEIASLSKLEPPDPLKVFQAKHKTLKNSYHLVSSVMSVVDSDSENSDLPSENEKCERIYTKSRTFFNKSAKFLESHASNAQLDDYSSKFINHLRYCEPQNGCSRWSYLVHSLETNKDCQQFLGGAVRISPQNKRHTHVISTGGNFTPVELGLDNYNRPLAVKRIPSGSCVCKLIKQLVTPLLGLRNTNILHYCACDFDNNELIIATPLCEYNMGQYVMLMKQNNKLTLNSTDIVRQLLTGIMYLHSQNEAIIHGNLKPSNIFIDSNDVVRVAEFGTHKALFKLKEAPNSSIIWFSTETFKTFKQNSKMECTCASDIQVAGMLIHFIITAGKHVYGDDTREILKNLEKAIPKFSTTDLELQDLLTWMLMFFPNERPTVQQVFSHVYFWSIERKWQFILTCAGITSHGTDIPINLSDFYYTMDKTAYKDNIKGKWTQVVRSKFPNPTTKIEENDDTPSGLLRYIRACVKAVPSEEFQTDVECCNFFISSFPAFTLSLYRIIDNTEWMDHPAFINFYTVHTQVL